MPNPNRNPTCAYNSQKSTVPSEKPTYNIITVLANATGVPKETDVSIHISLSDLKIKYHNIKGIRPTLQIGGDEDRKVIFIILKEAMSIADFQIIDCPLDSKVTVSHLEYTCQKDLITRLRRDLEGFSSLICQKKFIPKSLAYICEMKDPYDSIKQNIKEKYPKPDLPCKPYYSYSAKPIQQTLVKAQREKTLDPTPRDSKSPYSFFFGPQLRNGQKEGKVDTKYKSREKSMGLPLDRMNPLDKPTHIKYTMIKNAKSQDLRDSSIANRENNAYKLDKYLKTYQGGLLEPEKCVQRGVKEAERFYKKKSEVGRREDRSRNLDTMSKITYDEEKLEAVRKEEDLTLERAIEKFERYRFRRELDQERERIFKEAQRKQKELEIKKLIGEEREAKRMREALIKQREEEEKEKMKMKTKREREEQRIQKKLYLQSLEAARMQETLRKRQEKEEKERILILQKRERVLQELEMRSLKAEQEAESMRKHQEEEERKREEQRIQKESEMKRLKEKEEEEAERIQETLRKQQKEEERIRLERENRELEIERPKEEEQEAMRKQQEEKELAEQLELEREVEERKRHAEEKERTRQKTEEAIKRQAEEQERNRTNEETQKKGQREKETKLIQKRQAEEQVLQDITNLQTEQKPNDSETNTLIKEKSFSPHHKILCRQNSEESLNGSLVDLNDPYQPHGYLGLKNMGNTCFMNAPLQCLCNLTFANYFLRDKHRKYTNPEKRGFSWIFGEIIKGIKENRSLQCTMDMVKQLLLKLKNITGEFEEFTQNDALHFLKAVLDAINDDITRVKSKAPYEKMTVDPSDLQASSKKWFKYMLSRENSIVTDLFCGQLLNKTTCSNGHEKLSFDHFWDLPLSFEKTTRTAHLKNMLSKFLAEEDVTETNYCDKCGDEKRCKMQQIIWKLPKILVIYFKRFECFGDGFKKVNNSVTFPVDNLDLGPLITMSHDSSTKDSKYTLCGIVHHIGSLDCGHYTAQCKIQQEDRWMTFDDSCVFESDLKNEETSKSAYILFYIKSSLVTKHNF